MKAVKIVAILFLVYGAIVIGFESMLGFFQPEGQTTLTITTTDSNGVSNARVVARLQSAGQLYVAANHWPRAWYRQALDNPDVHIVSASEEGAFVAVPVSGAEHDRVNSDNSLGLVFRILTGFPPRYFVRLEPR